MSETTEMEPQKLSQEELFSYVKKKAALERASLQRANLELDARLYISTAEARLTALTEEIKKLREEFSRFVSAIKEKYGLDLGASLVDEDTGAMTPRQTNP